MQQATPWLVVVAWCVAGAARAAAVVTLVDDVPGAGRLAAPATGQTLYLLDDTARSVTAVDPFAPARRWRALGPTDLDAGSAEAVRPAALACIDSSTLAVACHVGGEWSLRVFRLAPPNAAEPAPRLLQSLALGAAPAAAGATDVFVSETRDWLAVTGLPAPLPAALRAPIAGARLGGFSTRLCPRLPPPGRLVAATGSPFDEWVLFLRRKGSPPDLTRIEFHATAGRQRLLDLDLGLAGVRDAASCRGDGTLWVVADGEPGNPAGSGLWRIDAVLEAGRQAVRPVLVAGLPQPLSVVCLSERAVAISGGGERRRVILVNPSADAAP